ncbi:hypothetical protein J2847_005808 [Azospirillum agricola]|uniref:hypothetical protein n=1 Tax=Azospirillum agricola TaxID=1720247 RepID=UPI001AE5D426|nr:hypothetical protein [Azospirillum agricola]MBP2232479.1 hypothetical protein [Azospirillum agricola]
MHYEQAKRYLADLKQDRYGRHRLAPADTKSWLVSYEGNRGGNYWYTVTWNHPGILTVGGDIGEITLTHYNAMNTWENAAAWVNGSSYDYLLGKSNHRREYDPDDTFTFIMEDLVREAKESLLEFRKDLKRWSIDMQDENAPRSPEAWDPDEFGPYWIDQPEPLRCTFTTSFPYETLDQAEEAHLHYPGRDRVKAEAPEGWQEWLRLYDAVGDSWQKPDEIFTPTGRRALKRNLRDHLGGADSAANLCQKLGHDDYYGSYSWSHQSINMIAALHRWAALVVETDEWRIARDRAAALAEHRKHAAMFDRRMPKHGYSDLYAYAPGVIPFNRDQPTACMGPEPAAVAA